MIIDITKKEDTIKLATEFAKNVKTGNPILLYGTLGIGKTFFTSHLIQTLLKKEEDIPSPTFSILQTYETKNQTISHYDLYRIKDANELFELDIDNSLKNNITIIEWPEIIEDYIKENFTYTSITFKNKNNKKFIIIENKE